MTDLVIDIETIPQDTAALEAAMPEEMRNPVMPPEIACPEEPNWQEKAPKYAAIKDEKQRAEKVQEWIETKHRQFVFKADQDRDNWRIAQMDARASFVESAALHAATGHVKMIGILDRESRERTVLVWESDKFAVDRIKVAFPDTHAGMVVIYEDEAAMIDTFYAIVSAAFEDPARIVTFYGNTFDLPFIARRGAIAGAPGMMRFLRKHRRGRYLDSLAFVDLRDEWTMGDREEVTGGLEGLATMLGFNGGKTRDGATFYRWYQENPEEGVHYLLNDLAMTEFAGVSMGVL